VRNVRPTKAGNFAGAYGMDWKRRAARPITLKPAEISGVRIASAPCRGGQSQADVVIWSGDPFEFARNRDRGSCARASGRDAVAAGSAEKRLQDIANETTNRP